MLHLPANFKMDQLTMLDYVAQLVYHSEKKGDKLLWLCLGEEQRRIYRIKAESLFLNWKRREEQARKMREAG